MDEGEGSIDRSRIDTKKEVIMASSERTSISSRFICVCCTNIYISAAVTWVRYKANQLLVDLEPDDFVSPLSLA